jgi:tetratricopeptide (TPR) repeat protein
MKQSRLLMRLDDGIKNARSTLEADCLRAERAGYLARIGQFDQVSVELAALHERYDPRPNAEISAWLNLVEGLVIYFSAVGLPTNDKVKRSLALSSAAGIKPLQAISSAWLAQFDYVRTDIDSMARNIRISLTMAASDHHSAQSRVSLVVAQALHLAGRPDLALMWYRRARDHAVADGDDATTSALMHNMGWLRMMLMRQSVLSGNTVVLGGNHALMNAESTSQFDALIGDTSWDALKPVLRAQVLSLQGDYSTALDLYERHLVEAESEGTSRLQGNLLADKAWCLAISGHLDAARECARSAMDRFGPDMHSDDRAAAHSRLAQVCALLIDVTGERLQLRMANEAWHMHELLQKRILELLETLAEDGDG